MGGVFLMSEVPLYKSVNFGGVAGVHGDGVPFPGWPTILKLTYGVSGTNPSTFGRCVQ